jgi:hypothetical protein
MSSLPDGGRAPHRTPGPGGRGAPDDRYKDGAPLPQTDDPELKAEIDEWIRLHPGTSRAQAMDEVLRRRGRDATAKRVLTDVLASAIEHDAPIEFINEQLAAFTKFILEGDTDNGEIDIRKAA